MTQQLAQLLEQATAALNEGRAGDALRLLGSTAAESPDGALLACLAQLELGELSAARRALERAASELDVDDPDLLWARGECHLHAWEIDAARGAFRRLSEVEPSASAFDRLSLCYDIAEDFALADELLARAHALDPQVIPRPARIAEAGFDAEVDAAMRELTDAWRAKLSNTRIVVEPVPFRSLAPADDPLAVPPDALGLFVGANILDASSEESGDLPPTIYLFQRNLERACGTHDALRAEVRITLYHEIAHRFGFDEDGVDALGLT